jgi:hypothetical protein
MTTPTYKIDDDRGVMVRVCRDIELKQMSKYCIIAFIYLLIGFYCGKGGF